MTTKQTGKKLDARERARLARTRVDQVRAERDTLIAQLAAVENSIGHSVQHLFTLGENTSRIADLLALQPKEVKRLRGLATAETTSSEAPTAANFAS